MTARSFQRRSTRLDDLIDLGCVLVTVLVVLSNALDLHGPLRVVASFVFVLFVPGRAIVANWPRIADSHGDAMSIIFSVTIVVSSTTVMLWLHLWDPSALVYGLSVVTSIALVLAVVRRHRALSGARSR